jgi:hypothetical protein
LCCGACRWADLNGARTRVAPARVDILARIALTAAPELSGRTNLMQTNESSVVPGLSQPSTLTVVIVPLLGGDNLVACLKCLPLSAVECIVVLRGGMDNHTAWAQRYPTVMFVDGGGRPVPLRRQQGVELAQGALVALLEDTTRPDAGWCEAVYAALADASVAAASGPVRISSLLPSRHQALAWSEYGEFHASRQQRQTPGVSGKSISRAPVVPLRVAGNNMAFRRAQLLEVLTRRVGGLVEGTVCDMLRERGLGLIFHPAMSVTYAAPDCHGARLGTRLQHGRIYAATRAEGRAWPHRLVLVGKSTLLPVVLSARTLSSMIGAVQPAAMPAIGLWVCLLESAWAVGEAVGAITGAGNSLEAWR